MKRKKMIYLLIFVLTFLIFTSIFRHWDQIKEIIFHIFPGY